jgi:hypothetical protein
MALSPNVHHCRSWSPRHPKFGRSVTLEHEGPNISASGSPFGPWRAPFERIASLEAEVDGFLSWNEFGLDAKSRVNSGR